MRTVTRLGLTACAFVLWAGPALAQDPNVTFQVDMNPYIETCQHEPDEDDVQLRGNVFGWDDTAPTMDDDGDGTYSLTVPLAEGTDVLYKYFSTGSLQYEDATGDRTYTVTADANQIIPEVVFADGEPVDQCGGTEQLYEIRFTVDMAVAIQRGVFNPDEQEVYVTGGFNGWDTSGNTTYRLLESSLEDDLYVTQGFVPSTLPLPVPSTQPYKFILRNISDGVVTYESGSDRLFELTGDEPDANGNDYHEAVVPRRFYEDLTEDEVLTAPATVNFEIDMRPAYYLIEDTGSMPGDSGGGNPQTSFDGVWLNGFIATESEEGGGPGGAPIGWIEPWDPSGLGTYDEFRATDADGDSVFTITLTYPAGAARILVGKLGAGAYDNEAAGGNDHFYAITEGTQTIQKAFGAMRQGNGLYADDNGPGGPLYDPYLLIDNDANPPTVEVVRSGGEADGTNTSTEPDALPAGITLGAGYPNPFATTARIAFRLEQAQDVTLRVYDVTGRLVATLAEGFHPAGDHTAVLDARGLASGLYVYRLEADGTVVSRTVTLVK